MYFSSKFFIGIAVISLLTITGCNFMGKQVGLIRDVSEGDYGESTTSSTQNSITITETTVGSVNGCSVGVSNIWQDSNDKKRLMPANELKVSLAVKCPSSENGDFRVGKGEKIKIGNESWLIADILEGKNSRGSVTLVLASNEKDAEMSSEKFSCSGLEGFAFNYPVFKGWEPLFLKDLKAHNSECVILLSYADSQAHGISADPPPQIKISKEYYHGTPGEMEAPAAFAANIKNPQGVLYHKQDNYAEFWVGDAVVKIQLVGIASGYNFSEKVFWEEILKTFSVNK